MKEVYSNIRGTFDFDPATSFVFRKVEQIALKIFKIFAYEEVILPVLEEKDLFIKGVGRSTDIVERQMFKIESKDIVLRPEGTAQVVRYYLQNSLYKQSDFHKFFYIGPMFRGERPQKGRLRQFHHIGAEAIGSDSIYLDAEIISLSLAILNTVGIKEYDLKINTLGCVRDRDEFSRYIKKSLADNKKNFCEDCVRRLENNPLRILDCKNTQCRRIVDSLSTENSCLCESCSRKFKDLLALLRDLNIKFMHVPFLVRGLDYYTNTVFEIASASLGSQDAIGAGGRYNNLIKSLGGPDIPAIGFALGVERMLLLLDNTNDRPRVDVFMAASSSSIANVAFKITNKLRQEGISSDCDYTDKSLKGQLRLSQKYKARYVVIVGEEELKENSIILKDMQSSTQEKIAINNLIVSLKNKI